MSLQTGADPILGGTDPAGLPQEPRPEPASRGPVAVPAMCTLALYLQLRRPGGPGVELGQQQTAWGAPGCGASPPGGSVPGGPLQAPALARPSSQEPYRALGGQFSGGSAVASVVLVGRGGSSGGTRGRPAPGAGLTGAGGMWRKESHECADSSPDQAGGRAAACRRGALPPGGGARWSRPHPVSYYPPPPPPPPRKLGSFAGA